MSLWNFCIMPKTLALKKNQIMTKFDPFWSIYCPKMALLNIFMTGALKLKKAPQILKFLKKEKRFVVCLNSRVIEAFEILLNIFIR